MIQLHHPSHQHQLKLITCICPPSKHVTLALRFMLKKGSSIIVHTLTQSEKEVLATSLYGFCQMITKPVLIEELIKSHKTGIASSLLINEVNNFMEDPAIGTSLIKTNLLTAFGSHIKYPLASFITNNTEQGLRAATDVTVPVRSLAEIQIAKRFQERFNLYIETCYLTGDSVLHSERTNNTHQDVEVSLKHDIYGLSKRTFDIKSGNYRFDEWFKGRIYEVSVYKDDVICYPNKRWDLRTKHYEPLTIRVKSEGFAKSVHTSMTADEFETFKKLANKPYEITGHSKNIYYDSNNTEHALMEIQTLPSFPKAFNFVNIVKIQDKILRADEMAFLNEMINHTNPAMFTNERTMQTTIVRALQVYNYHVNKSAFNITKPLEIQYPWLITQVKKLGHEAIHYISS